MIIILSHFSPSLKYLAKNLNLNMNKFERISKLGSVYVNPLRNLSKCNDDLSRWKINVQQIDECFQCLIERYFVIYFKKLIIY